MHIKRIIAIIPVIISILFYWSCDYHHTKELEEEIKRETITIPLDSLELLSSQHIEYNSNFNPDYRYFVYFDSLDCAVCKLHKMGIWHSIMKHTKDIGAKVEFIFVFHPTPDKLAAFREEFNKRKIHLKIYLDSIGVTERSIPILKRGASYRAFIIDKKGHIIAIGDASKSERIEKKYYKILREKYNKESKEQ